MLSFFMCTMVFCTLNAQTYASNNTSTYSASYASANYDTSNRSEKYTFQYLVGTKDVPGYEMRVCTYSDSNNAVYKPKVFSNGKSAPILQMYVENKNKYIGGVLEDSSGNKTAIKDIILVEKGSTLEFTVIGKSFSRKMELSSGFLLKETTKETMFFTPGVGPWKILAKI